MQLEIKIAYYSILAIGRPVPVQWLRRSCACARQIARQGSIRTVPLACSAQPVRSGRPRGLSALLSASLVLQGDTGLSLGRVIPSVLLPARLAAFAKLESVLHLRALLADMGPLPALLVSAALGSVPLAGTVMREKFQPHQQARCVRQGGMVRLAQRRHSARGRVLPATTALPDLRTDESTSVEARTSSARQALPHPQLRHKASSPLEGARTIKRPRNLAREAHSARRGLLPPALLGAMAVPLSCRVLAARAPVGLGSTAQ